MPHRSPLQRGTTYIDELGILELCGKFNSDSLVREQVPTPDPQRPEKSRLEHLKTGSAFTGSTLLV